MKSICAGIVTIFIVIEGAVSAIAATNVPTSMIVQGRLSDSTGTVISNQTVDVTLKIFDSEASGSGTEIWPGGAGETQSITTDTGGLWAARMGVAIPLTADVFSDSSRWIEIIVTPAGESPNVLPRIRLLTAPYAFRVATVDGAAGGRVTGALAIGANHGVVGPDCFVSGAENEANGSQSTVAGGSSNQVQGDLGFVGGGYRNLVEAYQGFIGGGRENRVWEYGAAVTAGEFNTAQAWLSVVGGGHGNSARGQYSAIVAGLNNVALADQSGVFTGIADSAIGARSVVLSGWGNRAGSDTTAVGSFVCGGLRNKAYGSYSMVGNGVQNRAYGEQSVIINGSDNLVEAHYSSILCGQSDTVTSTAQYSCLVGLGSKLTNDSTFMVDMPHVWIGSEANGFELPVSDGATGQVLVTDGNGLSGWADPASLGTARWTLTGSMLSTDGNWGIMRGAAGNSYYGANVPTMVNLGTASRTGLNGFNSAYCTVGGGNHNLAQSDGATVAGGVSDSVFANGGAILGGQGNRINGGFGVIGGGYENRAAGFESAILGGESNYAIGANSVIGGGAADSIGSKYAGIVGGFHNRINSDVDSASFIGGGVGNTASTSLSTIGGGRNNTVTGAESVIGGGYSNSVSGVGAVVCGGSVNNGSGEASGVVSGWDNGATARRSFVGGGAWNRAEEQYGAVLGGANNRASGFYSAVGGGQNNHVQGDHALIPGGLQDTLGTAANISMAFGNTVYINTAYRVGLFDGTASGRLGVNRDDRDGGISYPVHIGTNATNGNGAHLTDGGTWVNGSSREFKDSFQPLSPDSVLDAIARMPIRRWQYRGTDEQHVGPVAEDFVQAFDVGTMTDRGKRDDQYLSPADLAGIALVAIQELDKRTQRIGELERELESLRSLVNELTTER